MSDAPEVMWRETIKPNKMYPNGGSFYYEKHKPSTVDTVPYRRADLLPTLSAAMELPEVKELMEAMERAIEAIDAAYDGPDDNGAYTVRERAALAAIKEPKT